MLTVTDDADSYDLVTLATVKAAMSITGPDEDDFLKSAITQASDVIARHCRRVFALEVVTETLRPDQSKNDLVLARYPVAEITSVVEGNTTVDPTMYEINVDSGVLRRLAGDGTSDGWWPASRIVVTYSAGFDLPTDTPAALQKAATRLVKAYYDTADRDLSVRSLDVPGVLSRTYLDFEHLPFDAEALLAPFRNMRFG
jgi:uncharacterized phiE125 gp8 family phage protein